MYTLGSIFSCSALIPSGTIPGKVVLYTTQTLSWSSYCTQPIGKFTNGCISWSLKRPGD